MQIRIIDRCFQGSNGCWVPAAELHCHDSNRYLRAFVFERPGVTFTSEAEARVHNGQLALNWVSRNPFCRDTAQDLTIVLSPRGDA